MSDNKEAAFKLAVTRSQALYNFYEALRNEGMDALKANEMTHEHAKWLDNQEGEKAL